MAILADYLIVAAPNFALQLGATGPTPRAEISFTFRFPAGVVFTRSQALLHYVVRFVSTPGFGNQMGLSVEVNGVEVHRQMFLEGSREALVEAIVGDNRGAPFSPTGANTMRFLPISPTNETTHQIMFGNVILWFQRDSTTQG